jgi:hypothetical protein
MSKRQCTGGGAQRARTLSEVQEKEEPVRLHNSCPRPHSAISQILTTMAMCSQHSCRFLHAIEAGVASRWTCIVSGEHKYQNNCLWTGQPGKGCFR